MRTLIVLFILLVMFGYGCAEDENQGFLLDEITPFLVEKSEPEQEREESEEGKTQENEEQSKVEVEQKDEQEQTQPEESVQEKQEEEQVTAEKDINEQKEVVEPNIQQTQEEKSPVAVESFLVPVIQEEQRKEEKKSKPPADTNKLENIVNIQLAIALQAKKNELAELEQKLLKIECEKTKLSNEIKDLQEPPKKSKTNKPVYVSGSTSMPPGQSMFTTLMVSSVDGMRAFVRDGGTAYYVRKGNRVTKGIIKDITSQGVFVQEETGVVLYPVTH